MAFQKDKGESVVAEIEALGRKAIFVVADVAKRDQVVAAVDAAAEKLGGFDVIGNNAGIAQVNPLLNVTEDELNKIFQINVNSVVWGIQAAAAKFEEFGHGGKIISAASIAAIQGFPILSAYSASKFAVRGFTQAAAQELAPKGITVNAYAPGIVGTGMWELIDVELSKINGKPLGQNLAKVVSFFAGPDSDYVTGQVLLVDGGMLYN